jgi:uncharacterized membrane protein YphA (DoxX/SURF4 family)
MDMIGPQNRGALQLMLVRLSTALTFVLQALPKLFHGMEARADMAHRLGQLGVPHSLQLVMLSGVIEMALSLLLTLGYGTRGAAGVAVLYLALRAYAMLSAHAIAWLLVCGSLCLSGGGRWSVDGWLKADPDA